MAEKTFEEKMDQLEQIVQQLEQGNVPLQQALEQFQQGIALSKELQKTLQDAEQTLAHVIDDNGEEQVFEEGN